MQRPSHRPSPRHRQSPGRRSEEHTSELQSHHELVCRLLLEKTNTSVENTSKTTRAPAAPSASIVNNQTSHIVTRDAVSIDRSIFDCISSWPSLTFLSSSIVV